MSLNYADFLDQAAATLAATTFTGSGALEPFGEDAKVAISLALDFVLDEADRPVANALRLENIAVQAVEQATLAAGALPPTSAFDRALAVQRAEGEIRWRLQRAAVIRESQPFASRGRAFGLGAVGGLDVLDAEITAFAGPPTELAVAKVGRAALESVVATLRLRRNVLDPGEGPINPDWIGHALLPR